MSNALILRIAATAAVVVVATSCGLPPEEYARKRRLELLTIYPPGSTARLDVAGRWAPSPADISQLRPAGGWASAVRSDVRAYTLASEKRTGKPVYRCERYWGSDGTFLGLEYNWFFYDEADIIVDVAWQYHTD